MVQIYGLCFILGVFGDFAFSENIFSYPYAYRNEDPANKLFNSLFDNIRQVPKEARNEAPKTTVPIISKPQPTENVVYIPIYEEPAYDPNYYPIVPPYPAFHSAPVNSQFQFNKVASYYPPPVNNYLSVYPYGIDSVPYLNPDSINSAPERIILQPISPNFVPLNIPISIFNTDADREAYAKDLVKIMTDMVIKKQQLVEDIKSYTETNTAATNDDDEYKIFKPWTKFTPTTSTYTITNPTLPDSIIKKLTENEAQQSSMQNMLNSSSITENINQTVELNKTSVYNSSKNLEEQQAAKITLPSIEIDQFGTETASQNDTDESRKLDFNINQGEEVTEKATIDKSTTIFLIDLIKNGLGNNETSTDALKLKDRFVNEFTTQRSKIRKFTNIDGNECTDELVNYGRGYRLITCDEKGFNGKDNFVKKTTYQSDVTYFTEELPTTTELTPQVRSDDAIFNNESMYNDYRQPFNVLESESATLNTVMYPATTDE